MGNVIQIKRGPGTPPGGFLTPGELGYDYTNGYLYIGSGTSASKIAAGRADGWKYARHFNVNLESESVITISGVATTSEASPYSLGVTGVLPISHGGTGLGTYSNANAIITVNANKNGLMPVPTASGALYSTGANTALSFGTLPIGQGGTGATDAAGAAASIVGGQAITPATIQVGVDQYYTSSNAYGIDMNNSDIVNVNGIWFKDAADTTSEGIHFYRADSTATALKWDTLWANNGELYLSKNCALTDTRGTTDKVFVYNTTNGGTISGPLTLTGGGDVAFASSSAPALIIKPSGQGTKIVMDGNEILCQEADTTTKQCLWINGLGFGPTIYGTSAPNDTVVGHSTNGGIYFQVVS